MLCGGFAAEARIHAAGGQRIAAVSHAVAPILRGDEIPVYPPVLEGLRLYLVMPIELPAHVHGASTLVLSITLVP